jgi:hypothetical protein
MKKGARGRPFLWSDDQAGQVCGDEACLTVTDPRTERGMEDCRLNQRERASSAAGRCSRSNALILPNGL